ncbi:two-component system, NarL family, sensor histidine kinase DesK [Kytococcus aerolatus]|uniref:Two-component system, NarL family, sensor histidine kinase DesK n=1 Tax=Kytococcus aerolatus TaxID=592308 RepID=A0A212TE60_9MICO|nr:histidine kinase [Kytococcus aerolatus]SNC64121.1 two-component system, NarL family, sensor histidine kinase DesK [Kytococcus aerolatus]
MTTSRTLLAAPRFGQVTDRSVTTFSPYTQVSVGFIYLAFLAVATAALWQQHPDGRWFTVPLVVSLAACLVALTRRALPTDASEDPGPAPGWLVALTTALGIAVVVTQQWPGEFAAPATTAYTLPMLAMLFGMALRWRAALALSALPAAAAVGVVALHSPGEVREALGIGLLALTLGVPMGYATAWSLHIVREQARARHLAADLAVAEERLRFGRDLHDLLGRTLSVVTLKSELAAELSRRGDGPAAAAELDGIHGLAQDGLEDLRGVVRGYRSLDPATELAGARALLRSSGVEVHLSGENALHGAGRWPEASREALGWCLREAVTNILRHSEARRVEITCSPGTEPDAGAGAEPDAVTLTVTNDRPRPATSSLRGAGLTGLRERVAAADGHLEHRATDTQFTLTATVPTREATA